MISVLVALVLAWPGRVVSLPNAHAHNDYRHPRPLFDALDRGFGSVEADIFLVDGKLLVGHDHGELRPERTLEALYLDPLLERVRRQGHVVASGPPFQLLIDIKANGRQVYEVLAATLERYKEMLTRFDGELAVSGRVSVVISGDRPIEAIRASKPRYCAVDGRMIDLEGLTPTSLMPLVSDSWLTHFRWLGGRGMPTDQREKLRALVAKAHAQGRKVRFWAVPERPEVWRELWDARVDYLGTDRLDDLSDFLFTRRPSWRPPPAAAPHGL